MTTFTETTADITVTVEPTPLQQETRPAQATFVFAYKVSIKNSSDDSVQLMERHWVIESADEQIGEVVGPGVVGLQPIVAPGETFQYSSSCVIRDPIGSMRGSYVFRRTRGGFFTVKIPKFFLKYSSCLH